MRNKFKEKFIRWQKMMSNGDRHSTVKKKGFLDKILDVEKEMLYKQRESILSKNPYGNTLYQLLALPKEQRARVIKKLDGRYTGDLNIK